MIMIRHLFGLAVTLWSIAAAAQDTGSATGASGAGSSAPWVATVAYEHDVLSGNRDNWEQVMGVAGRRFARGAAIFEIGRLARFGGTANFIGLDLYGHTWRDGYANARFVYSPEGGITAGRDLLSQVYQSVGRGFEASGLYRLRTYGDLAVHAGGAQIGLYHGNWYHRSRTVFVPLEGELGVVQTVSSRRYGAVTHNFMELSLGAGRGVEVIGVEHVVLTRTYSVSARVQWLILPGLGLSVNVGYSDDDFYRRMTLGAGVTAIW